MISIFVFIYTSYKILRIIFAVECDGLKIHLRASKASENLKKKIYEVAVQKNTSYKEEWPNPDGVI